MTIDKQKTGSTRQVIFFGSMLLLFALWLAFVCDLWNNYQTYSIFFPKISYLQEFQALHPGNRGGFQLYILCLGLPAATFFLLVLLPKVLARLFPRYRVWNIGYIVVCCLLILLMALLAPTVTKLYHNGEFFKALLKGYPSIYLKKLTTLNIHLTTAFFFLFVVFSAVLLVLEVFRKKPEGGLHTARRVGITLAFCVVLAVILSVSSLLLLNALALFSRNAVSSVYSHCVRNASVPMLAFVSLICAPIMEEIAFRGVICRGFSRVSHRWVAILLSAIAFGLWHRNLGQFVYTFVWGIMYGYLYLSTDRLCYTTLMHFLSNLIAILAHSEKSTCVFGQQLLFNGLRERLLELPAVASILLLILCIAAGVFILRRVKKINEST